MKKSFNTTGKCIPVEHYMVDISNKITAIFNMIEQGNYFVISRPRQYGKTTILDMLNRNLKNSPEYFPINISFEGIGQEGFESAAVFIDVFVLLLKEEFLGVGNKKLEDFLETTPLLDRMDKLGIWITELVKITGKKIVLLIDEVDKSSNNQLFLDFLGLLRNKYLKRDKKGNFTFHSVILAGLHDVKSLKSKFRTDAEAKFNSPWNIATDFEVELCFSALEIHSMLAEYANAEAVTLDIPFFADRLYYLTSGYPFLVSLLCKTMAEKILPVKEKQEWQPEDLEKALQIILKKDNTNFESLIQNLENNPDLCELVFKLIISSIEFSFNKDNPLILFGALYGILKEEQDKVRVHNRLYEQRIYNYMASKLETSGTSDSAHFTANYLDETGNLDMNKVLGKFQDFMKEHHSEKDLNFLERNGTLLFLAFLRPILNGRGFDFKEVQISAERRLDVVITFDNKKFIIELKIWHGDVYHAEGILQLCRYLDLQNQSSGYLLIFDPRKESGQVGKTETIATAGKTIMAAWV